MSSASQTATFYSQGQQYHADTCQPLDVAALKKQISLKAYSRGNYPGQKLPNEFLTELLSVGVWDSRRAQTWGLARHRNEGIEITYLAKGHLAFGVDGAKYQLKKGDLTLTRPWQPHYVGEPVVGYSKLFWLIIDVKVRRPDDTWQWPSWIALAPNDLADLTNRLQHTETHVWLSDEPVRQALENLMKIIDVPPAQLCLSQLALAINFLLLALLTLLKNNAYPLNRQLSSKTHTVERFLNALPEICSQDWQLDNMAAECGLKRSQFSEYCYEIKGLSPMEYLKHCRVNLAKQLLLQTALSITDIAMQVGFGSSQYFATVFKNTCHLTPKQFRQQQASS
ncbi:AraC family transcriptional regulator [Saccharobesus litoralis]|uniref:AraC family transcriptional regulator n=1 Tax=Saccharobesus litoralis TaxID=2172099 RepID=A0A2S0VNU2_9ALTE|nr:AraC family transcriptional regulator [Saccharobesus litoralis]AWB65887.1 AraC family transcriptional regulator [Saccharobesus litoralis]